MGITMKYYCVFELLAILFLDLCCPSSLATGIGTIRGLPQEVNSGLLGSKEFADEATTFSQVTQKRIPNKFTELKWKKACMQSYYDFVATLYFCQEHPANQSALYGYKLHPNAPCRLEKNNPLIRIQPGVRYRLTLVNTLTNDQETTNLHLHGLHLSGLNDRVWDEVGPGNCLHYNWTIPDDHMDGTFFYHAHGFQSARKQVNRGAYGIVIVDPSPSVLSDPDRPQFLTRERLLILATRRDSTLSRVLYHSANGLREYKAVLNLEQGVWHYLRILVMDPVADIRSISFDDGVCHVRAASYDGIWRSTVPSPREQYEFGVTGTSRLGVAIQCDSSSTIRYFPTTDHPPMEVELRVSPSKKEKEGELKPWTPHRPRYLRSLLDEPLTQQSDLVEHGDDPFRVIMTDNSFNHITFAMKEKPPPPILSLPVNGVHEFEIDYSQYHPFHMHVQAFQITSPQGCGNIFEYGEFYDTVSAALVDRANEKAPCMIRFATHIPGPTLVHCHSLNHEGAMAWIEVSTFNGNVAHDDDLNGVALNPLANYEDEQCIAPESLAYGDALDCSKA